MTVSIRKAGYPTLVRAHLRHGTLDPAVSAELTRYFQARPDKRACEAADHGFDPLADPARYLAAEKAEGYHTSLKGSTSPTLEQLYAWEQEEDAEHDEHGEVAKEQPTADDVHVDTPSGDISVAYTDETKKKRRKRKVAVLKADDEQRIVYGIVLEPGVEDSQGDVVSKQDVELAAHRFLYRQAPIGVQHGALAPESVRPVESYVAPADFEMGGQTVRKGSWVLATHVPDEQLWQGVKKSGFGGYSVAGTGRRTAM